MSVVLYRKILVATDGSEHAKHALNSAVETAGKWGAELIVLTVVPNVSPLLYSSETAPQYIPELKDYLREDHLRLLREAADSIVNMDPNLKFVTRLEEGHPSSEIIKVAEEEDVDLIVMGSRGLGGITGLLLGSTSRHVVETCNKPILIVK